MTSKKMRFRRFLEKLGIATSRAGQGEPARPVRLIMGMDVGTSFSKAVVQLTRRRHLAVPFDAADASDDSRFLVPTAVAVMAGGKCRLGLHEDAVQMLDNIKMPLIDGTFTDDTRLHLTVFMTLLFGRVRTWAQVKVENTLGRRSLDWTVNLGVPTDSHRDEIVGEYLRCAMAAWRLAEATEDRCRPLTLTECRKALVAVEGFDAVPIKVFPEVVAQVSSYVQTPLRKDGVHVIVDAGGGTLDVTVFMVLREHLQNEEELVFPVFARTVKPHGTRYLVRHRWKDADAERSGEPSPFRNLPSEAATAGLLGMTAEQLRQIDEPFGSAVSRCIGETIKKAAGKGELGWPGRLLLVGGGSSVELYQRAFREYKTKQWKYKLDGIELPRPDDLEMRKSGEMEWHRMAVAYGLSFDPDDIGRIRTPEEIEPVERELPRPRWEVRSARGDGQW